MSSLGVKKSCKFPVLNICPSLLRHSAKRENKGKRKRAIGKEEEGKIFVVNFVARGIFLFLFF